MKPNEHKNCGGKFIRVQKYQSILHFLFAHIYKCNKCGKTKTIYKRNKE
jgi:hypothetical protein